MELLVDESTPLDDQLLESLGDAAKTGSLGPDQLRDWLRLFGMCCNHVDDISYEVSHLTQSYLFVVDGREASVVFSDGACSVYAGAVDLPDITLWIDMAIAVGLATGKINSGAAHMAGDIRYRGPKNGAVALQSIVELFLDELEV